LLRCSLWIWSLMFWHEFSWRHGCGNSPSVISLRASPAVAGFHRGRNVRGARVSIRRCATTRPEFAARIRFSEWPVRCGTEPERLAGRLAPSVFDLVIELSRIVLRPVMWLWHQLSNGAHPVVRMRCVASMTG